MLRYSVICLLLTLPMSRGICQSIPDLGDYQAESDFRLRNALSDVLPPNPDLERPAITFRNGDPDTIPTQSGEVLKLVRIDDHTWVDQSGLEKRFTAADDHACANVVQRMQDAARTADALSVNEKYVPEYRIIRRCFHFKAGTESDYLAAELNQHGKTVRFGNSLVPFRGPYRIGGQGTDVAVNRYFLPTWQRAFSSTR